MSKRGKTSARIVQAARNLRQELTPAEKTLWNALRGNKLAGLKFRRQHPFDRFVLDFYCVEQQLVIELDGSVHQVQSQVERDAVRTEFLVQQGIRVLRVSNDEIEQDLAGVLQRILTIAASPPPPLLEKYRRGVTCQGYWFFFQNLVGAV